MQIKGKLNGDVIAKSTRNKKVQEGKTTSVDVDFGFTRKQAETKLGQPYADAMFGTVQSYISENGGKADPGEGDATELASVFDWASPSKAMLLGEHACAFFHDQASPEPINLSPKVTKVIYGDNPERVALRMRFKIPVGRRPLLQKLEDLAAGGGMVRVEFSAAHKPQRDLPKVT